MVALQWSVEQLNRHIKSWPSYLLTVHTSKRVPPKAVMFSSELSAPLKWVSSELTILKGQSAHILDGKCNSHTTFTYCVNVQMFALLCSCFLYQHYVSIATNVTLPRNDLDQLPKVWISGNSPKEFPQIVFYKQFPNLSISGYSAQNSVHENCTLRILLLPNPVPQILQQNLLL